MAENAQGEVESDTDALYWAQQKDHDRERIALMEKTRAFLDERRKAVDRDTVRREQKY